jgi:hypothetical protein
MVAETFDLTLRSMIRHAPFRPFVIELVSGTRIVVTHPEALMYQGGTAVYLSRGDAMSIFDHEGVVRLTELAEAEPATQG